MTTVQEPPTEQATRCPDCGDAVDATQPFCLQCGRRLSRAYRRPPSWRIPLALIAALVVAVGIVAGYGITQLAGTDDPPRDITVVTGPGGVTEADPGETPPSPAPAAPAPPAPEATAPTTPAEPAGPTTWPEREEAYTVVLLTTKDKKVADDTARKAVDGGRPAGVFESDGFKRFEPGLFVVFSGRYENVDAASTQAQQLGGDHPGAYARFVEPR